jgi:hypothetical protein
MVTKETNRSVTNTPVATPQIKSSVGKMVLHFFIYGGWLAMLMLAVFIIAAIQMVGQ